MGAEWRGKISGPWKQPNKETCWLNVGRSLWCFLVSAWVARWMVKWQSRHSNPSWQVSNLVHSLLKRDLWSNFQNKRNASNFFFQNYFFVFLFSAYLKKISRRLTSSFFLTTSIHLIFRLIYLNLFPCNKQIDLSKSQ